MKTQTIFLAALLALFISIPVFLWAESNDVTKATVAQTQGMQDDAMVELKGNVVLKLGEEAYLFRDETGEMKIEIGDEVLGDQQVDPDKELVIVGEINRDEDTGFVYVEAYKLMAASGEGADSKRQDTQQGGGLQRGGGRQQDMQRQEDMQRQQDMQGGQRQSEDWKQRNERNSDESRYRGIYKGKQNDANEDSY